MAIPESLRVVPGLRVQQLGGPGSLTSIKTRGLPSEDTAVLIDGIRFRDAAAPQGDASGFLEDLVVTNVSRLEVLRGSGSSLYGSNAVGGVVNIVTDEGGGPIHGSVLGEGGGLGFFRTRAQVAGGVNNNRVVYSGGFSFFNVTRGIDDQDEARNTSGQGRILFRLTPTATISGRIYATNSRLQLNNNPEAIGTLPATGIIEAIPLSLAEQLRFEAGVPPSQLNIGAATFVPGANDPDNLREGELLQWRGHFTQRPTETFGYTISYQGLATNRSSINGPLGVGFQPFGGTTRSDFDARIHTLNARVDVQAGRYNFITGGYEFESENFKNPSFQVNPADNSDVDVTQTKSRDFRAGSVATCSTIVYRSPVRFARSSSDCNDRCSRPRRRRPTPESRFSRHRRLTQATARSLTRFDLPEPNCAGTSATAIERRHYLNASAPPSTASLVTQSLAIRVWSRNVRSPSTPESIRRFTTIECDSRQLTFTPNCERSSSSTSPD